ncbi:MAG: FAD-dependent oxidoreductase [Ginsengibacter sp.]
MLIQSGAETSRQSKLVNMNADLVITGGGMAGICSAITAARKGIKVVLVQDRPVLGGNASSEVRLWILGATSHMGNNNRWAREGGVIDEILIENLYRNKEGNTLILDTILLEKVTNEPNITLLLNTMVYEVRKKDDRNIDYIKAFCSQNSTRYQLEAPLFCDASGDGIVSFLSGAAYRMGAESKHEFEEQFAPETSAMELLGHTLYFYSKRSSQPVKYVPPAFALKDIEKIPKYKILNQNDQGCRLWWIEYGGREDTVHDSEKIKWELWRIVYGVWDYIKNSGQFEDVDTLTLEWVGTIPGKRESRRFEGPYILKQQDIIEQRAFDDAVAFGGWALDLHPADGIYSDLPSCVQWHSKGVYQIPYRCYISKDIDNLFFAGRIISATHVAFGSTRVMATNAHGGQAVGMAAALCCEHDLLPKQLLENGRIKCLQESLNETGQSIPGIPISHEHDLCNNARISASSTLHLDTIPFDGPWIKLNESSGQLLPFQKNNNYRFSVLVRSEEATTLEAELRVNSRKFNYTPDVILQSKIVEIKQAEQMVDLNFTTPVPADQYGFLIFKKNEAVEIKGSQHRFTGIVSVFNGKNRAVSNNGFQQPPENIGIESFEFWCPRRRPAGHNLAMSISPGLGCYKPQNVTNGFTRPYRGTNAWVAEQSHPSPELLLEWEEPQEIRDITLFLDADYDHPLESSLQGHPENVVPFCLKEYTITDAAENVLYATTDNHQAVNRVVLKDPVTTTQLRIRCKHPSSFIPAGIFEIIIK